MTPKELYPTLTYSIYQVSLQCRLTVFDASEHEIMNICKSSLRSEENSRKSLSSLSKLLLRKFLVSDCCFHILMQDNGLVFISCGKWRAISTLQNLFLINCPVTAENIIAILNNETECSLSNCFTGGLTTVGIFFGMLLMDYYRKKEYVSSFIQSRFASKHSRNIHAISSETVSQFYAVSQLSKEQLQKLCIHMSSFLLEMYSSKQGTDYFALAENEQRRMDLLLTIIKKLGQMKESFDTYERILVEGKEQSQFHMQKSRTDIVVHNFLANLVLSSVLIGATTGNSFGTNLNIPLYYSTKGYKAALWYIVVFSVILAVGFLILIFLSCNKILVKYIKSQRNQSFQVLQRE